ncbi:DUF3800 domain-containing protein [Sorangium sp. So ce1182]|uniref:DUF3800 domain-containing protein n=1 Tax=Sorangium sp. So ce1182 TaxID=3133334 RepID=UPI003F6263F9
MANDIVASSVAEPETDPPPGVLRWLISCDESGVDGSRYYGFGTLWMKWQRRGDFSELIRELRMRHRYDAEIKWTSVRPRYIAFYRELIELFFRTNWIVFHCLVVRKSYVNKGFHDGDYDLARRKHFTMLLTDKIGRSVEAHRGRQQTFRIWVDPIASSYKKADEAVEVISNNVLSTVFQTLRPVDKVFTHDSKSKPSIQLCDLLLGAVMAAWRGEATADVKIELQRWIAHHLGWPDLRSDTRKEEKKFNIWYFYDPTGGPREVKTRRVKLVYPMR